MKLALITGINGLLGSNLARLLLREGYRVRGLVRPTSDLRSIQGCDAELIEGDVRDAASVARAVDGADLVFHTAALISYLRKERDLMFAVNIEGTRIMAEASLAAKVRRFIHTSSIAALPLRTPASVVTEESAHDGEFLDIGYRIAKYRSEQIVLGAVARGLDAVVLNPSIIMGPGDYRFHGGRMIRDVYAGRIFYAPPGGSSVVSVEDVAKAHVAAAKAGRTGERYILAGENLTYRELFRTSAEVVGGIPPLFTVPVPAVKGISALSELFARAFGTTPWLPRELVAGVEIRKQYSSEKARRELGFSPKGFRETVRETFEWYRKEGLL